MTPADRSDGQVATIASRLLGRPVTGVTAVDEGGNSRVYQALAGEDRFIVKRYFCAGQDPRNRLLVEATSLGFLWASGVRQIPEPIGIDETAGVGVYEFVAGERVSGEHVGARDIDMALEFISTLKALRRAAASRALPPASEACFSLPQLGAAVEARVTRLEAAETTDDVCRQMRAFLRSDWRPRWNDAMARAQREFAIVGFDSLSLDRRTLSPSDFGFHNARRRDGQWVFFDFEYFGWDDPAKLISDFLLHPAMALRPACRQRFLAGALARFEDDDQLRIRLKAYYPLFALKWCLILLNEFVEEFLARRRFAQAEAPPTEDVRLLQLNKARRMLINADREASLP